MDLDQPVCLCFRVSRRKLEKFIRLEKPQRAGQLSECFGAGTGCGWCRPFLERLFQEQAEKVGGANAPQDPLVISHDDYVRQRAAYLRDGGGDSPPDTSPDGD
ncbi:MAG: (2Fe-2S)-binding protein [Mariniblastus sp.]|nr:(2Fe-2S)-binding protein [Mariniblastus sp.]